MRTNVKKYLFTNIKKKSSKLKYSLYTWIRIRILNADLDPATQNNAAPDPKPWV
jgi:hypothetical protein